VWLSNLRTTTQKRFDPLGRDGVTTVHCAEKGSSNRCIRVCVPTTHDGVCHAIFQVRGMKELPQRIPESGENPALLVDVIVRWGRGRAGD